MVVHGYIENELRRVQEQALVFARTAMELGLDSERCVGARIRLKYFEHDVANGTLIPSVADRNHFDSTDPIPVDEGLDKGLVICKVVKNKVAVAEDLSHWDSKKFPGISDWVPIKSIVGIPLRTSGRIAAVIAVDCNENFCHAFKDERRFIDAVEALGRQLELVLTFYECAIGIHHTGRKPMLSVEEITTFITAANSAIEVVSKLAGKVTDLFGTKDGDVIQHTESDASSTANIPIHLDNSGNENIAITLGGETTFVPRKSFSRQLWPNDVKLLNALDKKLQRLYVTLLEAMPSDGQSADPVINARVKTQIREISVEIKQCTTQLRTFLDKIGIEIPPGYFDSIESAIAIATLNQVRIQNIS